ncbi:MAG: multiprotein bridging factor aMBF1 [Fervidicoccaceae archaeon]
MPEQLYCELCGSPISGRSYKVTIEGVSLTVCEKCYRKQSAKVQEKASLQEKNQRQPSQTMQKKPQPKIKQEVELEVVEDYAKRIREARERLGINLLTLSQKVMEKETVLKRIEQNRLRPSIDLARRLERALGIRLLEPVVDEAQIKTSNIEEDSSITLGDIVNIRKKG